jgi:hypothetical protein
MPLAQICVAHVRPADVAFVFSIAICLAAVPAFAQGRSQTAPGQTKDKSGNGSSSTSSSTSSSVSSRAVETGIASPITATTETSAPAAAANAAVYYGSWLDDASVVEAGQVWVGLATGYWRGSGSRQIDAPVASVAVGINSRTHAGGSLSFFHFSDVDGLSENGLGSISLYGKFLLIDPAVAAKGIGLAITPLVEFSPSGVEKVGWALPVNIESRKGSLRIYGSAGYFSRGSIFGTVGADHPVSDRVSVTASFGQSYARSGTHQTTIGVGVFATVTSTTGIFAGLGQTYMPVDIGPGGLSFAGGMSFFLPDPRTP